MTTFTEQFDAANGTPIQYQGRELHQSLVLPAAKGDVLTLRFLRSADRPVQGFGINCEGCQVKIANTVGASIALWRDTAPEAVTLQVVKAKAGARLIIFNQWRDEKHGSTMYHLNNAAMEVATQADDSLLLRCSDGWGGPDFDDLVAEIRRGSGEVSM